jgi:hypothetical protein
MKLIKILGCFVLGFFLNLIPNSVFADTSTSTVFYVSSYTGSNVANDAWTEKGDSTWSGARIQDFRCST